jgi:hypothetical protein
MRILILTLTAIEVFSAAGPARAQTYDPNYPVCMQVFFPASFYDCSFTSLPQCAATASGRPALCRVNPYFANALEVPTGPHHRQRRAY